MTIRYSDTIKTAILSRYKRHVDNFFFVNP